MFSWTTLLPHGCICLQYNVHCAVYQIIIRYWYLHAVCTVAHGFRTFDFHGPSFKSVMNGLLEQTWRKQYQTHIVPPYYIMAEPERISRVATVKFNTLYESQPFYYLLIIVTAIYKQKGQRLMYKA